MLNTDLCLSFESVSDTNLDRCEDLDLCAAWLQAAQPGSATMVDLLRGFFVCCTCNDATVEPESEGVRHQTAPSSIFKSYRSKSRTELAEDVIEPRLNLNGWTVRNGQKIVMMEIEKETNGIGVALEGSKGGHGLVITRLEANGLVAEWNLDRPLRAVNVGDVIVEVNKKRGTSKELSKLIQKEKQLQLLVECS